MIKIRDLITKIQCKRFKIPYIKGTNIHPFCSILNNGGSLIVEGLVSLQNDTFIGIKPNGIVKLGKDFLLNAGARIYCMRKVSIGQNVLISPYVYITDFNHEYKDPLVPIKDQGLTCRGGY